MILYRLFYQSYILLREPLAESFVLLNNLSRDEMVAFATVTQAEVVIGCRGIDDVGVHLRVMLRNGHAVGNHRLRVVNSVSLVEALIQWQYLRLHKVP
jgi:hypothetical protein